MKTLVVRNYIETVDYRKGYEVMFYHFTDNFSIRKNLVQFAKTQMKKIVDELNESCMLTVLSKGDMERIVFAVHIQL